MAILKIARMGHPVLASAAGPIGDPSAASIKRLVSHMIDTLNDAGGAGLAAPQVHEPLRLVIFHVPAEDEAAKRYKDAGLSKENGEIPLTVLINPGFEPIGEEMEEAFEGCLSIPGMTGLTPRFKRIRYRGLGLDGQIIERNAEGFHARVVQHELDHLDGTLFPFRIADLKHFGFMEEMKRHHAAGEIKEE